MPFDQRSLIQREGWFPPCFVKQNQQETNFFPLLFPKDSESLKNSQKKSIVVATIPPPKKILVSHVLCHMSHGMCHISCVTCHISCMCPMSPTLTTTVTDHPPELTPPLYTVGWCAKTPKLKKKITH